MTASVQYKNALHTFWYDRRPDTLTNQLNHEVAGVVDNMASVPGAGGISYDTDHGEDITATVTTDGWLRVRATDDLGRLIIFNNNPVTGVWSVTKVPPKFAP